MKKSDRWNNRQLEHYARAVEGRTDPPRYLKFRAHYLSPPPLKIIDAGCASGDISTELANRGYTVIGLDFPDVINKTKKKYPDLNLVAYDLNDGIPITIKEVES